MILTKIITQGHCFNFIISYFDSIFYTTVLTLLFPILIQFPTTSFLDVVDAGESYTIIALI